MKKYYGLTLLTFITLLPVIVGLYALDAQSTECTEVAILDYADNTYHCEDKIDHKIKQVNDPYVTYYPDNSHKEHSKK